MKNTSNKNPMTDQVFSAFSPSVDNTSQTRSVDFSPWEIQRFQNQHTLSLYAKILGRRVRYDHFFTHIWNTFKPVGSLEVISLSNEYFLIKFSHPSDYQNALQNGPWTINYNYIALLPWTPNFKPSERSIAKTKVWIRLYELPVEYYDKEALSRIAEEIAPLVKIDPVTESMSKCKFARFCVDLDLLHPLIDSVKLPNGFLQKIRYEGLRYHQCWGCRMVGHVQRDCPESTSIATQEVRRSWGSPRVLNSPAPEESRTPPGDASPVAADGSGFDVPYVSRMSYSGESRIRSMDIAPASSVADVSRFDGPDVSRMSYSGESRIRSMDIAPASSVADVSRFDGPDVSKASSSGESRIRPMDAAPGSSVANVVSGFDDTDVSRVNYVRQSRNPPFGVIPEFPPHSLSKLHIPEEEAVFIDSGKPCIEDNYFPNVVCNSQAGENQELMTPGSRMKHQAILRGVKEQEVVFDRVEFQEFSNTGLPKVLAMDGRISSFNINVSVYSNGNGYEYRNILTPIEIDHTARPSNDKNNVLFYNCRGARDPPVIRALKDLVEKYILSFVVLTETKTGGIEARNVIGELGFSGNFVMEPVENSGGVWILWDTNRITVIAGAHDQHSLYAFAQVPVIAQDLGESWQDVALYGVDYV